ncbi:MAG TPA: monovalent cation/H(+) antiporter subunit G [Solirubrobacterales bacterium]|nr:monovalent cation/H(+) antiporter subunit G [Solirubrobacterales bacterium]
MTFKGVVVGALLVLGVGLDLLAAIGMVAMRDTLDRLHYVGAAGFSVVAISAAILVEESFSVVGDQAIVAGLASLLTTPVLVHVTARTERIRRHGRWELAAGERVDRVRR